MLENEIRERLFAFTSLQQYPSTNKTCSDAFYKLDIRLGHKETSVVVH